VFSSLNKDFQIHAPDVQVSVERQIWWTLLRFYTRKWTKFYQFRSCSISFESSWNGLQLWVSRFFELQSYISL